MGLTQRVRVHSSAVCRVCMRIVKFVFRVVHDTRGFRHDNGGESVAADVDHSTEAVEEPVDSYNDGVHAGDGDVDGACRRQKTVFESCKDGKAYRKS